MENGKVIVLSLNFSRFLDVNTGVEFARRLDFSSGCYIGFAEVDAEKAKAYENRPGFQIPSAEEWAAICKAPQANTPSAQSPSGDPLADAASDAPIPSDVAALKKLGFEKLKQIAVSLGIELKVRNESTANLAEQIAAKQTGQSTSPAASENTDPSGPPPPPPSI